uniref:Uncharacterized protein n=1 Tax=Cacopsylla melanoneura TaxID=428564 RepID=A0A8D8MA30_9HEMI
MNRTIIVCISIVGVLLVTSTQASSTEVPSLVEVTTDAHNPTEPSIPGQDLIKKFLANVFSLLKEKFAKCALIVVSAKDLFRNSLVLFNSLVDFTKQTIKETREHCLNLQFFSCSKEQIRIVYSHSPINSDYLFFEASIFKFLLSLGNCGKIFL